MKDYLDILVCFMLFIAYLLIHAFGLVVGLMALAFLAITTIVLGLLFPSKD